MQELLKNLLDQLRQSSAASKATAVLVASALIVAAGVAGVVASKPHFEMLYSGLDASESAAIQRALSEGGIVYEVSQPPGPFVIYVEDGSRYEAQNVVAASGALERLPKGIPGSESGMSTIFMSANEREQMTRKRMWEETQRMLEALDFVNQAWVRTSAGSTSPFGEQVPVTASVTLSLRTGAAVGTEQAESVANLVRYGLGIERENLIISDHRGNAIFDGTAESEDDAAIEDWAAHREKHDRKMEERVNALLDRTFGPDLARITVNTEWNFERRITQSEQAENTKAVVSDYQKTSKTPQAAQTVGGAAGTASNLDLGGGTSPAATPMEFAETSDKKTEYIPSWTSTEIQQLAPELERLSVSLMIDETLREELAQLEQVVQAAVGFNPERGDVFQSMPIAFYKEEIPEGEEAPAEETGGGSPLLENVLGKATEVAAALAFVVLLFRSVKSAKTETVTADSEETTADTVDPEQLAQAQIEDLLESDPDRVSQILSDWVREESAVKST